MPKAIYTEIVLPEIVVKANALAVKLGFPLMPEGRLAGYQGPPSACMPQVGKLLQTLASGKPNGLIGEQGTGAGVGTAWLASGLAGTARLISVELNHFLCAEVRQLFSEYSNIEIVEGDCFEVMKSQPAFDLLFMDAAVRTFLQPESWDIVTEMLKIGGQIVMDDLVPVEQWPAEWSEVTDLKREFAFANPRISGVEVRTSSTTSALILTRIQ